MIVLAAVLTVAATAAQAQSNDPCQPAAAGAYGNPLVSLIGQFATQQRAQACAAERRSQWAEYNARQKAAHDKAEADAAQQKQAAAQQAETQRQQDVASRAAAEHARAAAETRAQHRRDQARLAAVRQREDTDARRQQFAVRLAREENAPDNVCHDPKLARQVIDGWNNLDTMRDAGVRVIDIEHVTTVAAHAGESGVACHGIFVTNRGWRVIGTTTLRRNIAGDPIFVWERDASQDLSRYTVQAAEPQGRVGEPPAVVTQVMAKSPI